MYMHTRLVACNKHKSSEEETNLQKQKRGKGRPAYSASKLLLEKNGKDSKG